MPAVITPIPPTGLASPEAVKSALAIIFLDELAMTVDTSPIETDNLPQQAPKAWAARKSLETVAEQAYWWLEWRGRTPGIRTFGTPEYTRQNIDAMELAGYLPIREAVSFAAEWNAAILGAMNTIEGNRRLGGRILCIDRPILAENRIRADTSIVRGVSTQTRYHYSLIRFNVRTQDRVFTQEAP